MTVMPVRSATAGDKRAMLARRGHALCDTHGRWPRTADNCVWKHRWQDRRRCRLRARRASFTRVMATANVRVGKNRGQDTASADDGKVSPTQLRPLTPATSSVTVTIRWRGEPTHHKPTCGAPPPAPNPHTCPNRLQRRLAPHTCRLPQRSPA